MIRKSASLNTAVLDEVAKHIRVGMSTAEIDKIVYDFTVEHGGIPAPLTIRAFQRAYVLLLIMKYATAFLMKISFFMKEILLT